MNLAEVQELTAESNDTRQHIYFHCQENLFIDEVTEASKECKSEKPLFYESVLLLMRHKTTEWIKNFHFVSNTRKPS